MMTMHSHLLQGSAVQYTDSFIHMFTFNSQNYSTVNQSKKSTTTHTLYLFAQVWHICTEQVNMQ